MKKILAFALTLSMTGLTACGGGSKADKGLKVLEYGAVAVAGSSDPNDYASMYDLDLGSLVYDTLYEYDYLARPYKLIPAMAEGMPKVTDGGKTYTIKLKKGIEYIDDACFKETNGKGREAVAGDFVYNLYRKADSMSKSQNWWLISGQIAGLDALREKYNGKPFDYSETIDDLKAVDDHTIRFTLKKPFPQIMWVLAMAGMTLYPKECVDHYGEDFDNHPVGTGPFRLVEWQKNAKYTLVRNEKYRKDLYPSEGSAEDKAAGRLADAGKQLPFADKVIVHEFSQSQPYWLQFRAGKSAWGRVPGEFTEEVFEIKSRDGNKKIWEKDEKNNRVLADSYGKKYNYYPLPLLDFIYRAFNYEDEVVGGEKGKKLRQAIMLAHDLNEENDLFYNGLNKVYAGIIPPGVGGFDDNVKNPYHGPDLEKAKKLLAEAGYPGGKGLPELQLCGGNNARTMEQAAAFIRNVKRIGVKIRYEAMRFAELSAKLKQKRCQMMGLAWGGDWPDAQNFIQLAYGPNKSPGSNNANYDNPKLNKIYEKASVMPDSPERNALYQQMNQIAIEDSAYMGSMARTRDYLVPFGTKNFKPEEMIHTHAKYIRLEKWEAK
jgi:ABC-type transport system substrate-binding protein